MEEANEFDPTQDLATFQAEREEETRAKRGEVLDQFKTARRKAVGYLHLVATEVAATQEDDVAGTELAAEFYEHVAQGLARSDVAAMFSSQSGANQAQVIELESVRGELGTTQQQLAESEQINEQLRQSAHEASDLRAKLTIAQRELSEALSEINRLKREADKPNPLQDEVARLTAENTELQQKLTAEELAHEETKAKLVRYEQADAPQDTTSQPELADAAPSGDPHEPEPAPVADQPADDDPQHQSPHTLAPREEAKRRGAGRRLVDRTRGLAPGHSNPHNDQNGSDK